MGGLGGCFGVGGFGGLGVCCFGGFGVFVGQIMLVGVVKVQVQNVDVFFNGLGVVILIVMVIVWVCVDGQLMKLYYKEGQVVKVGDLLVEIDLCLLQVVLIQVEG